MKILVVDDESNKLKAIMRVVREIDGIELDSVDITLQLNEAKEKLLNHRYDLMILDLNHKVIFDYLFKSSYMPV